VAVRIAPTGGKAERQMAADLGVGLSTQAKWIQRSQVSDLPPKADIVFVKFNERLHKKPVC
jgi:transposase